MNKKNPGPGNAGTITVHGTDCGDKLFLETKFLELAVPILSFGGTLAGILLWNAGVRFDIQYAAFGSVLGSCILAYLAWIRPRRDIVALSTPIYAVVFFLAPIEYLPGIIIQLLYATGLTILLVRLKVRFGTPKAPARDAQELGEPLLAYAGRVRKYFPAIPGEVSRDAGDVFIRFARGEYGHAADRATRAIDDLGDVPGAAVVTRAFSVLAEQSRHLEQTLALPDEYLEFAPEDSQFLACPQPAGGDPEQAYHTTLYNALLLLFAVAWNGPGADRDRYLAYREFALKLFAAE